MSSHKAKKAAQLKKNKYHQMLYHLVALRRMEAARVEDLAEVGLPKKSEEKQEKPVWSARTEEIRNKLTGQKRASKERWNRFAGTEGGGGRGL